MTIYVEPSALSPADPALEAGAGGKRARAPLALHFGRQAQLTALLSALAFFAVGIPCVFTSTAAHTLFLQAIGPEGLPFVYLAEAVVIPMVGAVCLAAEARLSLRNFVLAIFATDVVALLALAAGQHLQIPHLEIPAIIWFEIEAVLNGLALWGLAGHLLTLREGKRLFGVIAAGEPAAVVVGGFLTPLLLHKLSVGDLFLISAAGVIAGAGLVVFITNRYKAVAAPESREGQDAPRKAGASRKRRWWSSPYILSIMGMAAVSQLAYFMIDNAFYIEAEKYFPTEQELAGFLGIFQGFVGAASVIVSLAVSGPLLKRFGVRAGLLVAPAFIFAVSLAIVAVGTVAAVAKLVTVMLFANKLVDHALRYTLDRACAVTLYQPLAQDLRLRAQASMETVVEPLAAGFAGIVLFVIVSQLHLSPAALTGIVALIAGGWAAAAIVVNRRYVVALRGAVASRRLGSGTGLLDDAEGLAHLRRRLDSSSPGEVLYCLELLSQIDGGITADDIRRLLHHPEAELRRDAARRTAQFPPGMFPDLLQRVAAEPEPAVRGALIEAHADTSTGDIVTDLVPFLTAVDDEMRISAFAGIVRHGGISGMLVAGAQLLKLLEAPSATERRMGAQILGRIGVENVWRPLRPLLDDTDADVRLAALKTAGHIRATACLPALLKNFETSGFEHASAMSLVEIGPASITPLMQLFDRQGCPERSQRNIILTLNHFGKAALPVLRSILPRVDSKLRIVALRALQRCQYSFALEAENPFQEYLDAELRAAAHVLDIWRASAEARNGPAIRALRRCCEEEIARIQESIFLLLHFNFPDFDEKGAWGSYSHAGAARRAYALEAVETLLSGDLRQMVMPLLDGETLDKKQVRLLKGEAPRLAPEQRLLECALQSGAVLLPSTRACAVFAIHENGDLTEAVRKRFQNVSDPLVRDTVQALGRRARNRHESQKDITKMLTIEKVLILQQVSIFARIASEHLVELAHSAVPVELQENEVLMTEGDHGTAMFVIVNGSLCIRKNGVPIAEFGPGQVVGEMAALDPGPRSASVTSLERSLLLRIASADLDYVLMDSPECARAIIQVLCERLRTSPSGGGSAPAPGRTEAPTEPDSAVP